MCYRLPAPVPWRGTHTPAGAACWRHALQAAKQEQLWGVQGGAGTDLQMGEDPWLSVIPA